MQHQIINKVENRPRYQQSIMTIYLIIYNPQNIIYIIVSQSSSIPGNSRSSVFRSLLREWHPSVTGNISEFLTIPPDLGVAQRTSRKIRTCPSSTSVNKFKAPLHMRFHIAFLDCGFWRLVYRNFPQKITAIVL